MSSDITIFFRRGTYGRSIKDSDFSATATAIIFMLFRLGNRKSSYIRDKKLPGVLDAGVYEINEILLKWLTDDI